MTVSIGAIGEFDPAQEQWTHYTGKDSAISSRLTGLWRARKRRRFYLL